MKEAIILAGGLGTRLRSEVPNLPKCMAPINNQPFLAYLIKYLQKQGIERFVFSLGYLHEMVINYVKEHFPHIQKVNVIENEPLGTGGAISLAAQNCITDNVLVVNGDTMFQVDIQALFSAHENNKAICTLALKPMENFDRYGVVELNATNTVTSFKEKNYYQKGSINGGVYALNIPRFLQKQWPEKFSFEKDFLEKAYSKNELQGYIDEGYFIDIGIPEDFKKAQIDFQNF